MDKQLQNEVFTRLDALAEKLGVVSAQLWEVLVKQAYVDAVVSTISILLPVILLCASLTLLFVAIRNEKEWGEGPCIAGTVFTIVFTILTAMSFAINIGDAITGFANPEYFAFKKVLAAVK